MMPEPSPPAPDDEPMVGDARDLWSDDAPAAPARPKAHSAPIAPGDEYAMHDEPEPEPVAPAPRPIPVAEPTRRAAKPAAPPPRRPMLEPSEAVEQVWSRWAEWAPDLALLGVVGLGVGCMIALLVALGWLGMAFFLFLAGGAALVVLSYPLVITLERPVRMTPEQAVNDFFGALAHHRPHYRRMWLLLSTAGRTSGSFGSFEGFKTYWESRLAELKGDRAGPFTPLKFQVLRFQAGKSAGLDAVDAKFTIEIAIRGQTEAGPIAVVPIETSLARGPDRMWYLDQGTLPTASK